MKRIIVTGCYGQLGKEINRLYEGNRDIELINTDVDELDISNVNAVINFAKRAEPYAIINCAAYTAVDACETDQDAAFRVNALGPRNLAIAARETGAKLVHVSTDYVFDGTKTTPYCESDPLCPQTVYGFTKAEGERMIQVYCKN